MGIGPVVAGQAAHSLAALAVEDEVDARRAILIPTLGRAGKIVAGHVPTVYDDENFGNLARPIKSSAFHGVMAGGKDAGFSPGFDGYPFAFSPIGLDDGPVGLPGPFDQRLVLERAGEDAELQLAHGDDLSLDRLHLVVVGLGDDHLDLVLAIDPHDDLFHTVGVDPLADRLDHGLLDTLSAALIFQLIDQDHAAAEVDSQFRSFAE